jgi:hypothetical protein
MVEPEKEKLKEIVGSLLKEILEHQGFGEMKIDIKWLKAGHKEVLISAGKQFRFVVPVTKIEIEKKEE